MRIRYFRKVADATGVVGALVGQSTTRVEWDARMEAAMNANPGRFEIRVRTPHAGLGATSVFEPLPPAASFGDPSMDQVLRVEADDPSLPARIASCAVPLVAMTYVHVVGDAGRVWYDMAHSDSAMYSQGIATGYGYHFIDQILWVLAAMACAIEGRPAPAQPVATP